MKQILALITLLLALSGCGSMDILKGKKIDYKSAATVPTLDVPPDLTAPNADDRFAVPDTNPQGTATFSVYSRERGAQVTEGSTTLLPNMDKVRIERAGSQRWLVVQTAPESLWPTIRDFWQETGFIIKQELPEAGIMETDWAENRAKIPQDPVRNLLGRVIDNLYSTAERDKFRTRIDRGTEPGTSEVYISHRGMYEVYATEGKDRTVWQPRPADPELEAEMLRRLMVRLGVEESRAQAQLTADKLLARAKLNKRSDGASQLILSDEFDRAWRRIGLALDRVGFTVEDRDRSKGLYYVRYVDPEADNKKNKGILDKLTFWRDEKKEVNKSPQYRIAVADTNASGSEVSVQDNQGRADQSATASRILNLLYEQLK